jgi:hypothetical protein
VTNRGHTPAYRVVAQLKSRTLALQGIKLPFGRIDPGQTKQRARDIPTPHDAEAQVDVEATSSNATPAEAPHGIRLKPKRVSAAPPPPPPSPPRLSCSAPASQVTPGKRLRVPCEASNPGDQPVKGVSYKVAIASDPPTSAPGPADLAPHTAPSKFDVDVTLPSNVTPGVVQVTVTANAPDRVPVQQDISVNVVEPHKLCKPGELTIEDYRRKHKLLEQDTAAGNLTRDEFNDLLAELWSCVRK